MDESKFNMWRSCVAIVLADGKVSEQERVWIFDKIERLNFSDEQRELIVQDFESGVDFDQVVKKISSPGDRAFLLHQVRVISHLDGHFSAKEKAIFDRYEKLVLSGVDINEITPKLKAIEQEYDQKEETSTSIVEKFFKRVQKWLD